MRLIPMVCVAMLLAATFALELGSSNKGVAFVPAAAGPTKVRPDDLIQPLPRVVSLEEADRRYTKSNGTVMPASYAYEDSNCLLENCFLEVELIMAKHYLKRFILG